MDKNIPITEMKAGIDLFLEKESTMFKTIEEASFLSEGSKKRFTKFIGEFYKIIKDEKRINRMMKK